MTEAQRHAALERLLAIAHRYLSHEDRNIRDMAVYITSTLKRT